MCIGEVYEHKTVPGELARVVDTRKDGSYYVVFENPAGQTVGGTWTKLGSLVMEPYTKSGL